jgi:hypothetical protein
MVTKIESGNDGSSESDEPPIAAMRVKPRRRPGRL